MNVRFTLTDGDGKAHALLVEGFSKTSFTNDLIKAAGETIADLSTYALTKLEKGGEYEDVPVDN